MEKIKSFLPYHMFFVVLSLTHVMFINDQNRIEAILDKLPSYFLLNSTGLLGETGSFIMAEWFISSMLIGIAILFPITMKYREIFSCFFALFIGILLLGYIEYKVGYLPGNTKEWSILTLYCNIRAFAVLCLGIGCYPISEYLRKTELSINKKIVLSAIEIASYAFALFYACSNLKGNYDALTALILSVGITLTFSNVSIIKDKYFNNSLVYFFGG